MIEKHFGLILHLSRQEGNAQFFSYTLSIVSEGLQSTQSISLFTSFDCIDSMHTFAIKGSKYYREAIKELLGLPETIHMFKKIGKLFLRSFIRQEMTNKSRKVECTVKIINMYRLHLDLSFYEVCAQELSTEYDDPLIYQKLIAVAANLNWN